MIEQIAYDALKNLAGGQVFPDVAPSGTLPPYITYQAVAGAPMSYQDRTAPSIENIRLQVNVWHSTRMGASDLARVVEDTMRAATTMQADPVTGRDATYDEETKYAGTRQDFSVWINR